MVNSNDINDINAIIIALLKVEKRKTSIPKIESSYREVTGARIPFVRLGFPNLVDYLKTVPGVEVITMNNLFYVNLVETENDRHVSNLNQQPISNKKHQRKPRKHESSSDSHGSWAKPSKNVPQCILSILRNSSRGFSKAKLLTELSYVYCVNESDNGLSYHLNSLHNLITIKNGFIYANEKEDIESPASVPVSKQLCLDNDVTTAITGCEPFGQILPFDLEINRKRKTRLIEVEVVESYSPSFFWIHLLENKKEFNKMMKTLGEFYEVNYQDHQVPAVMLERGLNIACVFDGKWHRAVIKRVDFNHKVTVMFYDFGTLSKCPSNEVYHLHRSFTALPPQAVPCGLYGVAPCNGGKWPKRVRDLFNRWVYEKPLWANVIKVDVEKKSMLVILVDTSESEDFIMNDSLVNNKMAIVKKMSCVDPEDMDLYVDEFCEYYIDDNGIYKTIIPTTRHPESNGRTIQSSGTSCGSVDSANNRLESDKYDWKAFKSQLRTTIDEFIMLTMKLFHDLKENNVNAAAHGVIQNFVGESLTDSIMEIIFSFFDLDHQAQFSDISVASNESSVVTDDRRSERTSSKSTEELSSVDVPGLVPTTMTRETKRSQLETSIQEAVAKFLLKHENSSFIETNPFKQNFFNNDQLEDDVTESYPFLPTPFDFVSWLQESGHKASPALDNSSKHWNPFM